MYTTPVRRGTDSLKWGIYGDDVLPLWVADMDFTSPPAVIEALKQRVGHGVFGYALESRPLKDLIVKRMADRYGWNIKREDVILLPGVVAGFNLVTQAVTQPGGSILMQPPVYPPFFKVPSNAGSRCVFAEIELSSTGGYELSRESFEAAIQPDTHCFLLCNPHNPIGKVFSRAELEMMAEICLKHDIVICSDEIHCDLVFQGSKHTPIASLDEEIADNTVTLIAPSKTYNIAGLECAALICTNPELRKKVESARRGLIGGANLLGMAAAEAAYRDGDEWLEEVIAFLESNRDFLMGFLAEQIPAIRMTKPQATYLAWLDCRGLSCQDSPYAFFLKNGRVALNRGDDFGVPGQGHVRLNFGCSREVLTDALERMAEAVRKM